MSRNVVITAIGSHTGAQIAKLLLTDGHFKRKISSVTGLTLYPDLDTVKEIADLGAKIVEHKPGNLDDVAATLKDTGADAILLLPPGHKDSYDMTLELIEATKKANIPNVCFVSCAGCDLAERDRQPLLRSVIDLEVKVLGAKGDPNTATGHSPVVIRRGFHAENLLLYTKQAQEEGILPIPIGKDHKFAPISMGDVAQVVAHVLSGHGKHGFDDKHRGQLMLLTGPMLATGDELATAASKGLGEELKFKDVSEDEARNLLKGEAGRSEGEIAYLLEYFSLVREGKTNYISTTTFHDVTGKHPQQPEDFFKAYAEEYFPKRSNKRRKVEKK